MASKALSSPTDAPETGNVRPSSGLIAALLAPLPIHEEPVAARQFLRLLERDKYLRWDDLMEEFQMWEAEHLAAAIRSRRRSGFLLKDQLWQAFQFKLRALDNLFRVPAPSPKEVRWKARNRPHASLSPQAEAQFRDDLVRHAVSIGGRAGARKHAGQAKAAR